MVARQETTEEDIQAMEAPFIIETDTMLTANRLLQAGHREEAMDLILKNLCQLGGGKLDWGAEIRKQVAEMTQKYTEETTVELSREQLLVIFQNFVVLLEHVPDSEWPELHHFVRVVISQLALARTKLPITGPRY